MKLTNLKVTSGWSKCQRDTAEWWGPLFCLIWTWGGTRTKHLVGAGGFQKKNCSDFYQCIYASHRKSWEGDNQIPEEVHAETQWHGGRRGEGEEVGGWTEGQPKRMQCWGTFSRLGEALTTWDRDMRLKEAASLGEKKQNKFFKKT